MSNLAVGTRESLAGPRLKSNLSPLNASCLYYSASFLQHHMHLSLKFPFASCAGALFSHPGMLHRPSRAILVKQRLCQEEEMTARCLCGEFCGAVASQTFPELVTNKKAMQSGSPGPRQLGWGAHPPIPDAGPQGCQLARNLLALPTGQDRANADRTGIVDPQRWVLEDTPCCSGSSGARGQGVRAG